MKGQSFTFMAFLAPKIISGEKRLTNRKATEHRRKLVPGGIMHLFTGLRTPSCVKLGTATVSGIHEWNPGDIPPFERNGERSPHPDLSWYAFAQLDGFDRYSDFVEYFTGKGPMLCFYWGTTFKEEGA